MTDVVDKATRSRMMAGIKGKDTKPELVVRKFLHSHGLRYRLHVKDLPGKPDIVLPRFKTVVFVHGCFWHRHPNCRFAYTPSNNGEFWLDKLTKNSERDKIIESTLTNLGWKVIVVWECDTSDDCLKNLISEIKNTTWVNKYEY